MKFGSVFLLLVYAMLGCAFTHRDVSPFPEARDNYSFDVKILDFEGAVGIGREYYISRNSIVMTSTSRNANYRLFNLPKSNRKNYTP
jgi:hypothetical protein